MITTTINDFADHREIVETINDGVIKKFSVSFDGGRFVLTINDKPVHVGTVSIDFCVEAEIK